MSAVSFAVLRLGALIGLLLALIAFAPGCSGPSETEAANAGALSHADAIAHSRAELAGRLDIETAARGHDRVYAALEGVKQ